MIIFLKTFKLVLDSENATIEILKDSASANVQCNVNGNSKLIADDSITNLKVNTCYLFGGLASKPQFLRNECE